MEMKANQLLEATMAGTRGSQTSAKSSPASGNKTPAKRAASAPSGPPRKRGRPSKKDREERAQQQPQDTNDEDIAEESNGYTNEDVDGNAKNGFQQNTGRQSAKERNSRPLRKLLTALRTTMKSMRRLMVTAAVKRSMAIPRTVFKMERRMLSMK